MWAVRAVGMEACGRWGGGCSGGGVGVWVAREGCSAVGGRGGGCAGGGCGWGERVRVLRAVGGGGSGWRGWSCWAAIKHYSLCFGGASLFLGGKEDMWAVRGLGMEACGRWGRWV